MTRWTRRLINMFRRERLERELEAELESIEFATEFSNSFVP